ncbi:hypothetical protein MKX03_035458 [Papaver bracteatum]|nr:hypothetical protein MKX03_035458 [Papaver bracteatum]
MLFSRQTVLPLVLVFVFIIYCLGVDSRAVRGHKNVDCGSPKDVITILVDQRGHGDYIKIQDAVNSIPSPNTHWIAINLTPGVYREKVNITTGKNCILLQGNDRDETSIEWNSYVNEGGNPFESATFTSVAEYLVVKNITFKNTYNLEVQGRKVNKAVAASIFGDKSSFYDCGFIGLQDTLADASGRHYFRNCHIEGAMDFIWGNGQSIYEYCEITVQKYPHPRYRVTSVITAQGRESEEQTTGFVFKFGKLNGLGNPTTILGRAWRTCSTVLFKNMTFSGHGVVKVLPIGWDHWDKNVTRIVYAEADNTGLGSNLDDRVNWERIGNKSLTAEQWHYYTDMSFIDHEGWLKQQP